MHEKGVAWPVVLFVFWHLADNINLTQKQDEHVFSRLLEDSVGGRQMHDTKLRTVNISMRAVIVSALVIIQ
jgi:hypothetical protein